MPTILPNHYVLAVPDAQTSARFYVDALGFEIADDLGGWVFVKRDHCMIMLGSCPDDIHPSKLGCHNYFAYLKVDDVDGFHARLRDRGVSPLGDPADKPWGMREFAVTTPDGHRIMFGQNL